VTITNAGRTTTTFGLETTALVGIDTTTARVVVAPDSVRLGGGQSSVVRLELEGSNALSPGQTYESELRVKGYYEQRIDIRSSVQPDPSGHVEVEQGEPPTHIHAHHWYHHFQCTEPCTPT
jgi:hypothetical protein